MCEKRVCSSAAFGLNPENRSKAKQNNIYYLEDKLSQVQEFLKVNNSSIYYDPDTGREIFNASEDKLWFGNNVAFYISIGTIFNTTDKEFLDTILEYYFNRSNDMYLINAIKITNYNDDIIKELERQIHINNGNYHILMFVIVYADKADLSEAPEDIYSVRGLVDNVSDLGEIRLKMMGYIMKYGLTVSKCQISNEVERVNGMKDHKTMMDSKFDYNGDVDYDSKENRQLMASLKVRNERDNDFGIRQRLGNDTRACHFPNQYNKQRNIKPLRDSIHDEVAFSSMPTNKRGAYLKQTDFITPTMNKKDEYQLYSCDDGGDDKSKDNSDIYFKYDNSDGTRVYLNSLGVDGVGCRTNMQVPKTHAPKEAGRDASAGMMSCCACVCKNMIPVIK